MRALPYELCDVFTDRPLAGNPLAVFTDASGLDDALLQALAREMNLSESAFVLRPTLPDADVRIRIFTPTMELPFAGHPTLGSAAVLTQSSAAEAVLRLQTERGVFSVRSTATAADTRFGWMTQPLPISRPFEGAAELLRALGVERSGLPVELYDNGPHYVIVELDSGDRVASLRPDMGRLSAFGSLAFSVVARVGERYKTRCFAPGEGIAEDPATGAAAGAIVVHLARHGRIRFGDTLVLEQGAELARPSTLHACASGTAERLERVEVGGSTVVVARGSFNLPGL